MEPIKKIKDGYKVKGLSLEVKDIEPKTRRVTVMLSKFDNIDSDNDVIRQGAFAKSILERGPESTSNRKIQFLRHHDWEHQIGKFVHMEETSEGLIAIGELSTSNQGDDALKDYQLGVINEHSIGFQYVHDKMHGIEQGDSMIWDIKEVMLWEGSAVTFGANEMTPTLDVSKGEHISYLDKLNKKMDAIEKGLHNGNWTDERFYTLGKQLQVLKAQYNALITQEPVVKPATPAIVEPQAEKTNNTIYLNLL
jgi:HK97 family phage prohead protease